MENLVSHEVMVKEIKNLCWDNRYREGMTVEHLAEELDALAEDFDPYFKPFYQLCLSIFIPIFLPNK